MHKGHFPKHGPARKAGRAAGEELPARERAAQLGVPEYLLRLVNWEQLRALPPALPARRHCD